MFLILRLSTMKLENLPLVPRCHLTWGHEIPEFLSLRKLEIKWRLFHLCQCLIENLYLRNKVQSPPPKSDFYWNTLTKFHYNSAFVCAVCITYLSIWERTCAVMGTTFREISLTLLPRHRTPHQQLVDGKVSPEEIFVCFYILSQQLPCLAVTAGDLITKFCIQV